GEIEAAIRINLSQGRSGRNVTGASQDGTANVRMVGQHLANDLRVVFERPTLIRPARSRNKRYPAGHLRVPFRSDPTGGSWSGRHPEEVRVNGNSQSPGHFEIPIYGVGETGWSGDHSIVESWGPFAPILNTDA